MSKEPRRILARGLTLSNRGSELRYKHPVTNYPHSGRITDVKYDPYQGQTLVTLTVKVALDDTQEVELLD